MRKMVFAAVAALVPVLGGLVMAGRWFAVTGR